MVATKLWTFNEEEEIKKIFLYTETSDRVCDSMLLMDAVCGGVIREGF